MGDGPTPTGLTITHCYAKRDHYQVVLTVVVPTTGKERHTEKTFGANLTRKPVLNFSVVPTPTVHVGQAIAFSTLDSVLSAARVPAGSSGSLEFSRWLYPAGPPRRTQLSQGRPLSEAHEPAWLWPQRV